MVLKDCLKEKDLGSTEAGAQGAIMSLVGFMKKGRQRVLSKSDGGSSSLPSAIYQTQKSGGFGNHFYFPEAQGSGKVQHGQLSMNSINFIKYLLIYSSGTKMWLFSKVLSKATSIFFCIWSCITSLACIIVNKVYNESLFIEIEMAIMKPAIMNENKYTSNVFLQGK